VEERRQLLAELSTGEALGPLSNAELDRLLIGRGIMLTCPAKPTPEDTAQAQAWQPVVIQGQPLSQTILEERR